MSTRYILEAIVTKKKKKIDLNTKIRHRRPFHELIFASIETAPDRSHISLEYLCPFPAEKYSGIRDWTRHNNPVHLKQRRRSCAT